MPPPRRKATPDERQDSQTSLTRLPEPWMERRTRAFQLALNRKGMPMVWGVGTLRTDDAWKLDQKYLAEDKEE